MVFIYVPITITLSKSARPSQGRPSGTVPQNRAVVEEWDAPRRRGALVFGVDVVTSGEENVDR